MNDPSSSREVHSPASETKSDQAQRRESRWQFSIRGVLLSMLLMSVVLALVAPAVRSWTVDDAMVAGIQLFIVILPTAAVLARIFVQERVSREIGGPLLATAYRPGARDRAVLLWVATAGMLLLTAIVVVALNESQLNAGMLCFTSVLALGIALVLPPVIFDALAGVVPGQVEFCEHGLIESGRHFIALGRITAWQQQQQIITLLLDADDAAAPGFGPWQCQVELSAVSRGDVLQLLKRWSREVHEVPFPEEEVERT